MDGPMMLSCSRCCREGSTENNSNCERNLCLDQHSLDLLLDEVPDGILVRTAGDTKWFRLFPVDHTKEPQHKLRSSPWNKLANPVSADSSGRDTNLTTAGRTTD